MTEECRDNKNREATYLVSIFLAELKMDLCKYFLETIPLKKCQYHPIYSHYLRTKISNIVGMRFNAEFSLKSGRVVQHHSTLYFLAFPLMWYKECNKIPLIFWQSPLYFAILGRTLSMAFLEQKMEFIAWYKEILPMLFLLHSHCPPSHCHWLQLACLSCLSMFTHIANLVKYSLLYSKKCP